MSPKSDEILVNRAPVLTLWAAVVAERLGFNRAESLSLGKAVAGLTAQSKGRHLGIYHAAPKQIREARARKRGEEFFVELCGRSIPAISTDQGVRAVSKGRAIDPVGADRYLQSKFGDALESARAAMRDLARSVRPEALREIAFSLYERFRPSIPPGSAGWGAKGTLDLARIRSLASEQCGTPHSVEKLHRNHHGVTERFFHRQFHERFNFVFS